uniref:WGS project CBMI000000000 data, contig CS3069_c003039 n=1 Tax=Fusarium clavum TaxID=2594811 RepID=A0A090MJD6_9HYPO|nr:unnamed protein product [Fusarium clavum]
MFKAREKRKNVACEIFGGVSSNAPGLGKILRLSEMSLFLSSKHRPVSVWSILMDVTTLGTVEDFKLGKGYKLSGGFGLLTRTPGQSR